MSVEVSRAGLPRCRALPPFQEPKQDVSGVILGARHGLEPGVFTQSANRSPALNASLAGMHMPCRNTCRTRIHSSAHATSTPPLLSAPTVPGGASTGVPVNRALRIPSVNPHAWSEEHPRVSETGKSSTRG